MTQPISFQLSEDQEAFRAEVKRFMAETVIPHAVNGMKLITFPGRN